MIGDISRYKDELDTLMSININNLKKKQYEALKLYTINQLLHIVNLLENNEFDEIKSMLSFSPAGDDMGTDHYFIDFNYTDNDSEDCELDIYDMITKLQSLS